MSPGLNMVITDNPMIMMKSPSLVINSNDVPTPIHKMWITIHAPRSVGAEWTVAKILSANELALRQERSPLQNVVINCRGYPGSLAIGGVGVDGGRIDANNAGLFSALKGLNIGTIWLVAGRAAAGTSGKTL